ncbi:MAG: hypothetical protein AAF598_10970 [Bacteroidota bacterium]
MRTSSVREIKTELSVYPTSELVDICLKLAKFKKENKEYLTYLLFEAGNEDFFIEQVKENIDDSFNEINYRNFYYIKKSVRKQLKEVKKYIRFSKKKATEVELLMHFCKALKGMDPNYKRSRILVNVYDRQIGMIKKAIDKLHEDLQFDYQEELTELIER